MAFRRSPRRSAPAIDDLPDGVGFAVLDAAINSGPRRAAMWLQEALGVARNGAVGPATVAAAKARPALKLIGDLCDARLGFLRDLPGWERFGRGWGARVEDVRKNAVAMASAAAEQARTDLTRPTAPSLQIGGSISTAVVRPAPVTISASVPTADPKHIDAAKPAPRPSFWAGIVAAFTPKPKTEA